MSAAQSTARVAVCDRSVATMIRLICSLPRAVGDPGYRLSPLVDSAGSQAGVAQLAEQRFRKPQVGGSSPPSGSVTIAHLADATVDAVPLPGRGSCREGRSTER